MSNPVSEHKDTSCSLVRTDLKTTNIYTFIRSITDFFAAVYKAKHITPKEKKFFITLVVLRMAGVVSYKDPQAVDIFFKNLNWTAGSTQVPGYLGKLSDKGWVEYDTKEKSFVLPEFFEKIKISDTYSFDCSFSTIFNPK